MSTLHGIRRNGMDYVLNIEAILHNTTGLTPSYLPASEQAFISILVNKKYLPISTFNHSSYCFCRVWTSCLLLVLWKRRSRITNERIRLYSSGLSWQPSQLLPIPDSWLQSYKRQGLNLTPTASTLSAPQSTSSVVPLSMWPQDPSAYVTLPDIGSHTETAGTTHGPQHSLSTPYQAGQGVWACSCS